MKRYREATRALNFGDTGKYFATGIKNDPVYVLSVPGTALTSQNIPAESWATFMILTYLVCTTGKT